MTRDDRREAFAAAFAKLRQFDEELEAMYAAQDARLQEGD